MYSACTNQLNYQHLLYFWTVAREGTISKACESLFLTQPTISAQLRSLEKAAGARLFNRVGRNLVLTETGQTVYRYAEEIFSLGRELQATLVGRPSSHAKPLVVGIADVIPRMIVHRLLEPVLQLPEPIQLICHDDKAEKLLARLALHELDVVLSDVPASPFVNIKAFNHVLGECHVSIMGTPELVSKYQTGYPKSLDGAPFLLPMEGSAMRRSLDQWFDSEEIRPMIRCEFGDCDLFECFGSQGVGLFAIPTIAEEFVLWKHPVKLLSRVESIKERFFAISLEKRVKHAAVVAIANAARHRLFG
jgi:LysR family transcriptional regulator, transcriptional activator of nhaA